MINNEALNRIRVLERKYMNNWGKSVDYTVIPVGITQEKMVEVLERIVDTGESILVGFDKIKNKHYKELSDEEVKFEEAYL